MNKNCFIYYLYYAYYMLTTKNRRTDMLLIQNNKHCWIKTTTKSKCLKSINIAKHTK